MIIPLIIIGVLTGGSAYAVSKRKKRTSTIAGGMTSDRQRLFVTLLQHQREPKNLRKMADKFEGEGLEEQATKLRKFAAICELPKEKKDERRAIFRKAMSSTNREAIMAAAQAYDNDGCIGAAAALRKYANGLPPN
jgi:hypothetical protein